MRTGLFIGLILSVFVIFVFVSNSLAQVISIPDERVRGGICSALANLPDVEELNCNAITAQDMEKITELAFIVGRPEDYFDRNYNNIIGVEYAINLERFEIHRTFVSDITPLSGLTKLKWVQLASNEITDISALAGLTNLEHLHVGDNNLGDITSLQGLTKLTKLFAGGCNLTDISTLSALTNLEFLSITDNSITDISPLSALTNLTSLSLSGNQITDISPLSALTNLTSLSLSDNQISDVSVLTALTNLETLRINGNPIVNMEPLFTLLEQNPGIRIYLADRRTELVAPEPEPVPQIVVSEIMFETKGEIDKYPQWIELYNNDTIDINLNGWEIILFDRSFSIDFDFIIKPNKTVLIASHASRFSENIMPDNQWAFGETIIDESNLNSFELRLFDNEDRETDYVSTLDLDDYSRWDMLNCIVQKENDARSSIIRRFSEGEPVKGYKRIAWIRAYNTNNIEASDYWYGNEMDFGTPGYRSSDIPLPVNLSYFSAERTSAGAVLKWATESEVDNAGFNVYRSETRNGQFRQVNAKLIHGNGTTGERHEYTWTHSTAKPNTVYYYQIEDVSFAGERKQLATVRLKGLLSASGKLATRWADVK